MLFLTVLMLKTVYLFFRYFTFLRFENVPNSCFKIFLIERPNFKLEVVFYSNSFNLFCAIFIYYLIDKEIVNNFLFEFIS